MSNARVKSVHFTRRRMLASAASFAAATVTAGPVSAADTIKVGILHSLSGTMAISETTLKDVMLMLIDEQNEKGGLLGKKLEAVVVDPASNWPLFAEKARELISKDKVAAVFGCWTSVSRKSVLPVFKELNNILFYPVQFEGEEGERTALRNRLNSTLPGDGKRRRFALPIRKQTGAIRKNSSSAISRRSRMFPDSFRASPPLALPTSPPRRSMKTRSRNTSSGCLRCRSRSTTSISSSLTSRARAPFSSHPT